MPPLPLILAAGRRVRREVFALCGLLAWTFESSDRRRTP